MTERSEEGSTTWHPFGQKPTSDSIIQAAKSTATAWFMLRGYHVYSSHFASPQTSSWVAQRAFGK